MRLVFLSEVCEQIRGVSYKSGDAKKNLHSQHTKLYRANNISSGSIIEDDLVYVPDNRVQSRQLLKKGDIVVAASSGSINVVGKAAMVRDTTRATFGAFLKVLRPNVELIDIDYFGHFFQSQRYLQYIRSVAVGANINNLTNSHFDNIKIPLPPLEEQKRIAEILDRAQALIRKKEKVLHKFNSLRMLTFYHMFNDPIINKHGLPLVEGKEIIEFITSGSRGWSKYFSDSGEKFITIKNVKSGMLNFNDITYVNAPNNAEAKRTKVREGDLLLSITADLGRTAVVDKNTADEGAYINQHLSLLRLDKQKADPIFVSHFLESVGGKRQFESLDRSGVKSGLNFDDIRSLKILLPPLSEQKRFTSIIERIMTNQVIIDTSVKLLHDNYNSLLQRAFKGELSKQPVG